MLWLNRLLREILPASSGLRETATAQFSGPNREGSGSV